MTICNKLKAMDTIMVLGKRLKQAREDLGYSQGGLAHEVKKRFGLQIRQSHVSNIENNPGEKLPSLPVLAAFAMILETSTDYLLGLTDNSQTYADIEAEVRVSSGQLPDDIGELYLLWRKMDTVQRWRTTQIATVLISDPVQAAGARLRADVEQLRDYLDRMPDGIPADRIISLIELVARSGDPSATLERLFQTEELQELRKQAEP